MNFGIRTAFIIAFALLLSCGVPRKQHAEVVDQLARRNADYAALQSERVASEDVLQREISRLGDELTALETRRATLEEQLDQANAAVSMYESKTGGLEEALKVTKADISELQQQRAAAQRRMREYRDLARKLASMIASGQLAVKVRNNKMVIEMPNAILFDPGKTEIKQQGHDALRQLGEVLTTVEDRAFMVAGHTDNVPIKVSGYRSNWELSTARAANVLHVLQDVGVPPQRLAAAGFGEFDPIASNEAEEGRSLNRRTEIVLMPNISEIPALPADLFAQAAPR